MAIRVKGVVLGNSYDPDQENQEFLVTIQGSIALSGTEGGDQGVLRLTCQSAVAALLTIGQGCNIYLTLNGAEIAAIEGAVSVTPASTTD